MNNDSERAYIIAKEKFSLNFVYNNISSGLDFPLTESVKGFYNGNLDVDSLNLETLCMKMVTLPLCR